jgi:hypothetical protein
MSVMVQLTVSSCLVKKSMEKEQEELPCQKIDGEGAGRRRRLDCFPIFVLGSLMLK